MPRPNQPLVRIKLARARNAARQQVFARLPDEEGLERLSLRVEDQDAPPAGSRPQTVLADPEGRSYFFKLAEPGHICAELFAYRVRALGGCLHVPAAARTLELPKLGQVRGLLRPKLPLTGTLGEAPGEWSAVQREAMLREHPWEWLLANLDTHVDQYVLVGERHLPINIDWDHALVDLDQTELTRFNRRSTTVVPIRNLLYAEYVLGRLNLDFYGMQLEARRIGGLPVAELDRRVDRYAKELPLEDAARLELRDRLRQRQANLVRQFDGFVASLRREREDNLGLAPTRRSVLVRAAARVQDSWQRFVIVVLHGYVVRPVLRAYRAVLSAMASLRAG